MINETDYTNNPLSKEQENQIDALFAQYDNTDTPGCAVGVIQDGRFIYKKSFGMANLDYDIPITSDSKFDLASTTKQFTAACIVLLHLEGKLDFDDEVQKHIPELPTYERPLTIRHMLNHTSGLRDYLNLMEFSGLRWDNYIDTSDAVRIVCNQQELDFLPGEKYSYSNSGYIMLAEIVQRVSKKSIRDYSDEKIFKPLGMDNTFYNDDCNEIIKKRAISYSAKDEKFGCYNANFVALGDGNIVSTVNDLIKWDSIFYNPVVGGQRMLDLLLKQGKLNNGETLAYAFGLLHNNYKGLANINHGGSMFGFRSQLIRYPEQKTSMIILSNRADTNPDNLANQIADILLVQEKENLPESQLKTVNVNRKINLPEIELEKFCGCFWCDEKKLSRKIFLKDGYLQYWRSENSISQLIPVSDHELIMQGVSIEARLVFEFNSDSSNIRFLDNGKQTMVLKSYLPVEISQQELSELVGHYYSSELDVVYKLKLESGKLYLFIKDKRMTEVDYIMPNLFKVIEWGNFLEFIYNNQQEVTGLKLDSERAKNIQFIKQS